MSSRDAILGAAAAAVRAAEAAAARGTFGVGGAIVTAAFEVVETVENRVVGEHGVDTTAHVEMQSLAWLRDRDAIGTHLIVSSLEPCLMCGCAILLNGAACVYLAPDPEAGIGVGGNFAALPEGWRERARGAFRPVAAVAGAGPDVDALVERAQRIFLGSLAGVRETVFASAAAPTSPAPPAAASGTRRCTICHGPDLVVAAITDGRDFPEQTATLAAVRMFNGAGAAQRVRREDCRFHLSHDAPSALELLFNVGVIGSFLESRPTDPVVTITGDRLAIDQDRLPDFYRRRLGLTLAPALPPAAATR